MNWFEERVRHELSSLQDVKNFRCLKKNGPGVDFYSNDYLGISFDQKFKDSLLKNIDKLEEPLGSTGSRLISGNFELLENFEQMAKDYHGFDSALLFPSGYQANLALLSTLPRKGDAVIFDHNVHASVRDGLRLSYARSVHFHHNDLNDLEKKLRLSRGKVFIVVEALYSMDGDLCPLQDLAQIAHQYEAVIIVDEAHSVGLYGEGGQGITSQVSALLQTPLITLAGYGKAFGYRGASILSSKSIRQLLINKARPFIYSTAPSRLDVISLLIAYQLVSDAEEQRKTLHANVRWYVEECHRRGINCTSTPIQTILFPGNQRVELLAEELRNAGFEVSPIKSPTVQAGHERLRIVLHSFNTKTQISSLLDQITQRCLNENLNIAV